MRQSARSPAAACARPTCDGCAIRGRLMCVATLKDVVDFGVLAVNWFIPFFAGMIVGEHWTGLGVWIALAALFFGYVEACVLCRHCPAYAEKGFTLKCHANWGLPKIPKFDPRPMNRVEGAVFLAYGAVLFLYPVPFFAVGRQWLLLAWCVWALVTAVWIVQRTQCTRCYHLSCPANRVPEEVREGFLANYPDFARAWQRDPQHRA